MKDKIGTITSKSLAELCGVSQGTVDRALNDRPGISPKTKQRILNTAREYGYIKNMNASFLASGKTKLLGLVVFNFNNEFFAQLAAAVEKKAKELGYSVMIAVSNTDIDEERRALERMLSFGVDGVVLCPVGFGEEYDSLLAKYNKPIITVANKAGERIPFVGADDEKIMSDITEQIICKGYKRLVLYIPPLRHLGKTNIHAQKMRADGYKKSALNKGVEANIFTSENEVIAFVKEGMGKTAVLCASDIYALRLLKQFKSEGISVPTDVGLTGFDNIDSLNLFEKRLTTICYPISEIGEIAAARLVGIIEGKPFSSTTCKCSIIFGDTV